MHIVAGKLQESHWWTCLVATQSLWFGILLNQHHLAVELADGRVLGNGFTVRLSRLTTWGWRSVRFLSRMLAIYLSRMSPVASGLLIHRTTTTFPTQISPMCFLCG